MNTHVDHQIFTIKQYCDMAQTALAEHKLVLTSRIINIISFYGHDISQDLYEGAKKDIIKLSELI